MLLLAVANLCVLLLEVAYLCVLLPVVAHFCVLSLVVAHLSVLLLLVAHLCVAAVGSHGQPGQEKCQREEVSLQASHQTPFEILQKGFRESGFIIEISEERNLYSI